MSELYQTRTNQKLYFARLHLEALQESLQDTGWSKHALIESYNESTLFHLACGYQSFLREIAEFYRLETNAVETLADLLIQADQKGLEAPEIAQLQRLEENTASWLSQLLHAYQACWQASTQHAAASESQSLSEIHVIQVNPDHAEDGAVTEQLGAWLSQFRDLVAQLREGMQEW